MYKENRDLQKNDDVYFRKPFKAHIIYIVLCVLFILKLKTTYDILLFTQSAIAKRMS